MTEKQGRIAGKVALITGGASGLGKASAELFVREGGRVVIADINEAAGRAVAASLGEDGHFVPLDVTDEAQWIAAVEATLAHFGKLNILLQSAGIGLGKPITEIEMEEWRRVHAIDLDGVFLGMKHGIPAMAKSGEPCSIVNISSIAGNIAGHNMAAYNSAKAAVRHVSKSAALHCCRQGWDIRVNTVHPTFVDTPILDRHKERFGAEVALQKLGRQVPIGRVGKPIEVAYPILFLASDESSYMTGSELLVDGGISAM
ncbi:MAG: SDR family oxidoreductase [Alphaproteobacteria bacterium]